MDGSVHILPEQYNLTIHMDQADGCIFGIRKSANESSWALSMIGCRFIMGSLMVAYTACKVRTNCRIDRIVLNSIRPEPKVKIDKSSKSCMLNCRHCRHYFITWDKKAPHGCHAMNFKSRKIPARVVYESSGKACMAFKPKSGNKSDKKDSP